MTNDCTILLTRHRIIRFECVTHFSPLHCDFYLLRRTSKNRHTNLTINFIRSYTSTRESVALNVTSVTTAYPLNFYLARKQGHREVTSNICRGKACARFSRKIPHFPPAPPLPRRPNPPYLRSRMFLRGRERTRSVR